MRKLAGLLGETDGLGTADSRAVVGIGVNVDWPRAAFPAELAGSMTSLVELREGVDRDRLAEVFLARLEPLVDDLRARGSFPADAWRERQLTSGLQVRLELPDGTTESVRADDVDPDTGALLVRGVGTDHRRSVLVGEIRHLRFGGVV